MTQVHVYVDPAWRGVAVGEEVTRRAMRVLRRMGFDYALTLADDRGSGKLREWYRGLGFVGAASFGETAMVAITPRHDVESNE